MNLKLLDLGITDYTDCHNLQKKLIAEVKNNNSDGYLIVTEHYPVITIGRSGLKKNLLVSEGFLKNRGIKIVKTDRGGDITYHGPGQMLMYPIVKMGTDSEGVCPHFPKDLHQYLRYLEDVIIALLAEYDIDGFRISGKTGVWTNEGKIASIGIGVSRWVTYHGLALNINCDLIPFNWIYPCGFKDIKVTSMGKMRIDTYFLDKEQVKQRLIEIFSEIDTGAIFHETHR